MNFTETSVRGAYLIDLEPVVDDRGFFARTFCAEEFKKRGLTGRLVQCNLSSNKKKGTLRGMHYQIKPHEEVKLVCCTRGAIYDVILDLRPTSPTFKQWTASELTADNRRTHYIPVGCAHGFLTLEPYSDVFYQMSECYAPQSAQGVHWNDEQFKIAWPLKNVSISKRDASFCSYTL